MAVQLKNLANKSLGEEFQQEIADIHFKFKEGTSQSYENLDKVIVYLQEMKGGEGNVDAVNEVEIDTKQTEHEENVHDDEAIAERLQQIWELDEEKLILRWEGGST
ncbi:stage III sporulation protein AF [Virgibacillus halophilus]|uniref:Stage III sporulation protein AF n=2 Tax=Tigheibacillus halophilus TaxID=361280 RepID=A0ABU5CAY9_9BACI|nr:stage III sporulation protein AF [Virgibacillus halophilus]